MRGLLSAFNYDGASAVLAANLPRMTVTRVSFLCLFFGLLPCHSAPSQDADSLAAGRAAFKHAYAQVDEREGAQPPDSDTLRAYPLYPYLQAARIRRALSAGEEVGASIDQRAQTFTTHYENEPVGRVLREVWLTSLGERAEWAAFLGAYRADVADDVLRCFYFTARIALERTDGLAEEIASQWLTPRSVPDCEQPFDWLRAQGALSPDLIERRARLALEDNNPSFARQIAAMLPTERSAPLMQWVSLLTRTERELDALLAAPDKGVLPEALLAGWTRLARTNRDAAMLRYDRLILSRRMSKEEASPYALALALALAWDRRPESLEYFARVVPANFDDYALEWQARAALWAGNWELATKSIGAMSTETRTQARWRYWSARAAEQTGDGALARQIYESVLPDDNFYSLMAAARLDRPVAPHPQTLVRDPTQVEQVAALPELVRARELVLCDMRDLASAEWRQGVERAPEDLRSQTVHLASRWGWYDQAIATAAQMRVFYDYELLYPLPYEREVRSAAKLSGLPKDLIYSVMRQESLYRADAISSAGARGLLQMLPETARRTARRWKRPRPAADDLFNPEVNVPLGAAHLRTLVDRFAGQTIVALAGYNAGPNAAARWLPPHSLDPDIWIENIPYNETRNYVQRILWHNAVFGWRRTGEPQKADAWLALVSPPGEAAVLGQR